MKNILLVCNAGMSTSMLVQKMQAAAKEQGIEATIQAKSVTDAANEIDKADVLLLGPQVGYQKSEMEKLADGRIPVEVIDMRDYGTMNGKKVLAHALACFEIISNVGTAKSCYINAIHKAKEGDYEEAKKLIEEGNKMYAEGHKAHVEMIQKEASGESVETCLLLIHAEDQMMSAETFQVLAGEFIDLCKMINK